MASRTKLLITSCMLLIACQESVSQSTESAPSNLQQSNEDCVNVLWTYNNIGKPFMMTWCTSCHHTELPEAQRAGATANVNLDTYDGVLMHLDRISVRTLSEPPTMPPAGGPSDIEIQRLREWIICGAPQ